YYRYMIDLLRERGGAAIRVFGGGGGVIVPAEARALEAYGVARVYSPEDGQRMGLQGMINDMLARCDVDLSKGEPADLAAVKRGDRRALARLITALESGTAGAVRDRVIEEAKSRRAPVLGVTGTGGS